VQMKKKNVDPYGETLKIYRKATQKDIDIWSEARMREEPMKVRAREIAIDLKLEMKISDIEFQGDASKATFYYTANDRVDFRQLIKEFAREFSIRIEMKQVGFRQEAARLGGIGSCGRELCCSTWLTDFRSVNTAAARYQQLSLNPQKLAGQCGKLKCCLNYELDTYLDALKGMPDADTRISTKSGEAFCQKIDIFKQVMWFAYPTNTANWYKISVEQVKEMLTLNKDGKVIDNIEDFVFEDEDEKTINNVIAEDSLSRFDEPKRKRKPSRNKKRTSDKSEASDADKFNKSVNSESKKENKSNTNATKNKPVKNTVANENKNTEKVMVTSDDKQAVKPNRNKKKPFKKTNKNNVNKPNNNPKPNNDK